MYADSSSNNDNVGDRINQNYLKYQNNINIYNNINS